MKKLLFLLLMSMAGSLYAAGTESKVSGGISISQRENESYVDTGGEVSAEITTSATASFSSTITIPSGMKGFCAYPRTSGVRFSVGDNGETRIPAAVGTVAAGIAATESSFTVGGILKPDMWTCRLLPFSGPDRKMWLRSTATSVVVDLEFYDGN